MSTINGDGALQHNNPRSVTYIVPSGDSALATAGSLVPATGHSLNIADGQIAALSLSRGATRNYGTYLNAADTVAQAPVIQLVQGTPNSSDLRNVGPTQIFDKDVVRSEPINSRYSIAYSGKAASRGQYQSFAVGNVAASAGVFVPQDEAAYRMHMIFGGVRQDRRWGVNTPEAMTVEFTTPNFSTLAATYTDPVDYIAQHLAHHTNLQSYYLSFDQPYRSGNKKVVAFGINTAGGAGTTLTAAAALAVGDTFDYMSYNGTTHSFTVDNDFLATVATWITAGTNNITGLSTIEVIDTTTAGTAAGLGCDVVIFMALDWDLAVVSDTIPATKVRLELGLSGAFKASTPVALNKISSIFEGSGNGRNVYLRYKAIADKQIHSMQRWGMNNTLIVPPNYINQNAWYNFYIIEHRDYDHVEYSHSQLQPHRTVILLEANPVTGAATDATTLASLNAILAPWLNSCNIENGGTVLFT